MSETAHVRMTSYRLVCILAMSYNIKKITLNTQHTTQINKKRKHNFLTYPNFFLLLNNIERMFHNANKIRTNYTHSL